VSGFKLHVPAVSLRWFEEGEHCSDANEGDLLLVDHGTVVSDVIRDGQYLLALDDETLKPFTWCTHSAYIRNGGADAVVSEMGFKGYERRKLSDYRARFYCVASFKVDPHLASFYDDCMQGVSYGWAEYLPILANAVTDGKFEGAWGDSVICSTHTTMVLMGLGLFPDRLPSGVVPAHQARWVGAERKS
jgi:hypothetical protein